jgi:hypothetical protein
MMVPIELLEPGREAELAEYRKNAEREIVKWKKQQAETERQRDNIRFLVRKLSFGWLYWNG